MSISRPSAGGRRGIFAAVPKTVSVADGIAGDKQAAFLQLLGLYTLLTKEHRQGYWVNFHNRLLLSVVGRGYRQTIESLLSQGIIEVNETYSTGLVDTESFSKSYRFAKQHRHGQCRLHLIESGWAIARATKLHEIDQLNLGAAGIYYRGMFDRFRIDVDLAASDPRLQRFWAQWTIGRFASGHEFAKRCADAGRYHSLMTQLPRLARRYLITNNHEPTSVVDISACQPLLLGLLTMQNVPPVRHGQQRAPLQNVLPYGAQFCRREAPLDVQHWLGLCESREIYSFLCREIQCRAGDARVDLVLKNGRRLAIDLKALRPRAFKRACLIPLFDTIAATIANPVFQVMEHRFPTIAQYVLRSKEQRYQDLAYLLQRAESELMIDRLGETLESDFPDEPIQPIHDALLVRQSFANDAIAAIKSQFATVGLTPQVKTETNHGFPDMPGKRVCKRKNSATKASSSSSSSKASTSAWFQDMTGNLSKSVSGYFNGAV